MCVWVCVWVCCVWCVHVCLCEYVFVCVCVWCVHARARVRVCNWYTMEQVGPNGVVSSASYTLALRVDVHYDTNTVVKKTHVMYFKSHQLIQLTCVLHYGQFKTANKAM